MAETDVDNELLDYEEDEEPQGAPESGTPANKKEVKGSYVSIHSSGFRDFLLKPELLRAIVDCGFEHPSEGNKQCCADTHLQTVSFCFMCCYVFWFLLNNQRVFFGIHTHLKLPFVLFSVQHECIPQAILGMDILCQAKSGMGKTAVFVLATLQQIEPVDGQVSCSLFVFACLSL